MNNDKKKKTFLSGKKKFIMKNIYYMRMIKFLNDEGKVHH